MNSRNVARECATSTTIGYRGTDDDKPMESEMATKMMSDGELWSKLETRSGFTRWCKRGGWSNVKAFEHDTKVSFAELKGKWFFVTHNRVFTQDTVYEQ
jgi:hypothetical protein